MAERALLDARRKGALVTVLRLGEVMPSAEGGWPNPHALTHFLLAAFQRLGVAPDVPLRSDYTPVDHVAARVAAAVADRAAWGSTLHLFHSRSVDFGALLAGAGTPTERVACGEFLARLERAVAQRPDHDLTVLRALLPAAGGDAAALRAALRRTALGQPAAVPQGRLPPFRATLGARRGAAGGGGASLSRVPGTARRAGGRTGLCARDHGDRVVVRAVGLRRDGIVLTPVTAALLGALVAASAPQRTARSLSACRLSMGGPHASASQSAFHPVAGWQPRLFRNAVCRAWAIRVR